MKSLPWVDDRTLHDCWLTVKAYFVNTMIGFVIKDEKNASSENDRIDVSLFTPFLFIAIYKLIVVQILLSSGKHLLKWTRWHSFQSFQLAALRLLQLN